MTAVTQGTFAAALLDPVPTPPQGITSVRGGSDARRFAIYRNNVRVSLRKALAARFPVTERLVGDDFFRLMADAYVDRTRPASPLLFQYGDDLPDFIAASEPARSVPYLADVARLEAAWTRAYHAADVPPLGIDALAALDPAALLPVRLAAHPAAALIRSEFPVGSIWQAHQRDVVTAPEWRPEAVLLVRPGYEIGLHVLPASDAGFAAALLAGRPLGEATEEAIADWKNFDFGRALTGLVALGVFNTILEEPADE